MTYKVFLDSMIKNYETILIDFYKKHWIEEIALNNVFQNPDYYIECVFEEDIYESKAYILTRVILLNQIYSTRLQQHPTSEEKLNDRALGYKERIDVMAMVDRIFAKAEEIDKYVEKGDVQAIEIIRDRASKKYKDAYSFATKYCSFKNPEAFPIVDQYTTTMLKEFAKDKELSEYIPDKVKMGEIERDYPTLKKVHKACQAYISQNTESKFISCKYTDIFLWQCGKEWKGIK